MMESSTNSSYNSNDNDNRVSDGNPFGPSPPYHGYSTEEPIRPQQATQSRRTAAQGTSEVPRPTSAQLQAATQNTVARPRQRPQPSQAATPSTYVVPQQTFSQFQTAPQATPMGRQQQAQPSRAVQQHFSAPQGGLLPPAAASQANFDPSQPQYNTPRGVVSANQIAPPRAPAPGPVGPAPRPRQGRPKRQKASATATGTPRRFNNPRREGLYRDKEGQYLTPAQREELAAAGDPLATDFYLRGKQYAADELRARQHTIPTAAPFAPLAPLAPLVFAPGYVPALEAPVAGSGVPAQQHTAAPGYVPAYGFPIAGYGAATQRTAAPGYVPALRTPVAGYGAAPQHTTAPPSYARAPAFHVAASGQATMAPGYTPALESPNAGVVAATQPTAAHGYAPVSNLPVARPGAHGQHIAPPGHAPDLKLPMTGSGTAAQATTAAGYAPALDSPIAGLPSPELPSPGQHTTTPNHAEEPDRPVNQYVDPRQLTLSGVIITPPESPSFATPPLGEQGNKTAKQLAQDLAVFDDLEAPEEDLDAAGNGAEMHSPMSGEGLAAGFFDEAMDVGGSGAEMHSPMSGEGLAAGLFDEAMDVGGSGAEMHSPMSGEGLAAGLFDEAMDVGGNGAEMHSSMSGEGPAAGSSDEAIQWEAEAGMFTDLLDGL